MVPTEVLVYIATRIATLADTLVLSPHDRCALQPLTFEWFDTDLESLVRTSRCCVRWSSLSRPMVRCVCTYCRSHRNTIRVARWRTHLRSNSALLTLTSIPTERADRFFKSQANDVFQREYEALKSEVRPTCGPPCLC